MAPPKAWRLPMCAIALASNLASTSTVHAFVPAAHRPFPSAKTTVSLEHSSNRLLKLNIVANRRLSSGSSGCTAPITMMLPAAAADWASTVLSTGIVGGESSVGMPSPAASGASAMMMLLADGGIMEGMDAGKLGLFAFAGVGVAAAGFKTAVYWRMQYVVAALLTNRVPAVQGGAEVLELSAKDTKTLYYMPTGGVRRVTMSNVKDLEQDVVNGAAIQAKVPTALVRKQEGGKISCNSGTMDCVVSIYGFSAGVAADKDSGKTTTKGLAREVARVLKPGGTVLFVEKGEAKQLVEELQEALGSVEVNMVNNLVDPYCVALGTKTKVAEEDVTGSSEAPVEGGKNRRDRRAKKKAAQSRGA